jgi:CheY-like chemotaxis protein
MPRLVARRPRVAQAKPTRPKRILVVDDEPGVRRLLADLFASEGYLVSEASDGARALDGLQFLVPDVVILDLMMPVMSGRLPRNAVESTAAATYRSLH